MSSLDAKHDDQKGVDSASTSPRRVNGGPFTGLSQNIIPSLQSPTKFNIHLPAHELSQTTARLASPSSSPRKTQQVSALSSGNPFTNLPSLTYSTDRGNSPRSNSLSNEKESFYNVDYLGPITLEYLRYVYNALVSLEPVEGVSHGGDTNVYDTPPVSSGIDKPGTAETFPVEDNGKYKSPNQLDDMQIQIEMRSRLEETPPPVRSEPQKKPISYLQKILQAQMAKAEKLKTPRSKSVIGDVYQGESVTSEVHQSNINSEPHEQLSQPDYRKPVRKKRKLVGAKPDFTIEPIQHEVSTFGSPGKEKPIELAVNKDVEDTNSEFFKYHGASHLKLPLVDQDIAPGAVNGNLPDQNVALIEENVMQPNIDLLVATREDVTTLEPIVNTNEASVVNKEDPRIDIQHQEQPELIQEKAIEESRNNENAPFQVRHTEQPAPEMNDQEETPLQVSQGDNVETEHEKNKVVSTSKKVDNETSAMVQPLLSEDDVAASEMDKSEHDASEVESQNEKTEESGDGKNHETLEPLKSMSTVHPSAASNLQEKKIVDNSNFKSSQENDDDNGVILESCEYVASDVEIVKRSAGKTEQSEASSEINPSIAKSNAEPNVSEKIVQTEAIMEDTDTSPQMESETKNTPISPTESMFDVFHNAPDTGEVEIDTFSAVDVSDKGDQQPIEESSTSNSKDEAIGILEIDFITMNLLNREKVGSDSLNPNPSQLEKLPTSILQLFQSSSEDFLQNLMNSLKLYAFSRDSRNVDMSDLILYLRQINFGGTGETMGDIERIFDIAQENLPLELIIDLENSVEKALSELETGEEGGLFIGDEEEGEIEQASNEKEKERDDEDVNGSNEGDGRGSTETDDKQFPEQEIEEDVDFKNKDTDDDDEVV